MAVKDASQMPVNPALIGVEKNNLVYMTQTVNGIPPALLSPYTAGDAVYLADIGGQLDSLPYLTIDIEYVTTAPQTIVWYSDSPDHRATSNSLRLDWLDKFRVGYTGSVGFYAEVGTFIEYARLKLINAEQWRIDEAYNLELQYLIDMAPMIGASDVLYPQFYLDSYLPGEVNEKTPEERVYMFKTAVDAWFDAKELLYPGKPAEAFIKRSDLNDRLEHLYNKNITAHIWDAASAEPFSDYEVSVINYWNDSEQEEPVANVKYPYASRRFRRPPTVSVVGPPDPPDPPEPTNVYNFEDGSIRQFEDGSVYQFETP